MIAIADIGGEFDALMRLVDKLPKDKGIVLLGDLVDRGPKSKEVVEWAMTTPNVSTIKGNHEDMFIDWYYKHTDADYVPFYDSDDWISNGGLATLRSYGRTESEMMWESARRIDKRHIEFLKTRPLAMTTADLKVFLSHAPYPKTFMDWNDTFHKLWNRNLPKPMANMVQVFGHNSQWGLRRFETGGKLWAICLDQSRSKRVLTAYDCESGELYEEPFGAEQEVSP